MHGTPRSTGYALRVVDDDEVGGLRHDACARRVSVYIGRDRPAGREASAPLPDGAMSKIIVLSDPHMVPAGATIAGVDPAARLAAGIAHINAHHGDAEHVVVLGDLAHAGDPASCARIAGLLAGLIPPVSIVPGNHDDRAALRVAFPDAPVDEAGFLQQAIDLPEARLLLLDTLYPGPDETNRAASGRLCRRRMAWLEARLAESRAAGYPVLILMHHPPHPTGFANMDAIMLANGAAFHDLLARYPVVRHITCGHVHRSISGSHRGIAFTVLKSTAHQQPGIFDDDDSSLSVDEPAAYGLLQPGRHGVIVHSEDYELAIAGKSRRRATAGDAL